MIWWRKVWKLSYGDAATLAQAWLLLMLAGSALRLVPFRCLVAFVQKHHPGSQPSPLSASSVARLAELVEIAGRYSPFHATCLNRVMVLSWLLKQRGAGGLLRIGVSRQSGVLKAHAWLELDGQVILGHQIREHYHPIFEA